MASKYSHLVHWTVESILVMLPWWMWRSELGYDLSGTTTVMTREKLMAADAVIVFDERHRDAITRVLDYSYWNKIVLFNKMAFDEDGNVEDPHYQTAAVYHRVAKHIENGCKTIGRAVETTATKA